MYHHITWLQSHIMPIYGLSQVVVTSQTSTKMVGPDGNTANFDTGSKAILTSQLGKLKRHA